MAYIEVNKKLEHLSDEEINILMNKYYNGVKTSELIEEYKIDSTPSMLYKLFPPQECEDVLCPVCKTPMVRNRPSKSAYRNTNYEYCVKCGHQNSQICKCSFCEEKRQIKLKKQMEERERQQAEKQLLIREVYDLSKYDKVKLSELSFRDRVYLGALLRTALCEDMKNLEPLNMVDRNLAPTPEMTKEILKYLHEKRIIVVSPESDVSAFVDSDDDIEFPYTYYIYEVKYVLNVEFDELYTKKISSIVNPVELSDKDRDEALLIWKDIALQECLEYLKYQMKGVNFDFNAGEKTLITFKDILQNFSVSQVYGIIYKSIANATKYYQESNISRKQAANSVIGGCQRYAEKALIGAWDLTKYSRIHDLPQSVISEFFFNRVLNIGELGFDMPPMEL